MSKDLTATVVEIDPAAFLDGGFPTDELSAAAIREVEERQAEAEFIEMFERAPEDYERFIGLRTIVQAQNELDSARVARFEQSLSRFDLRIAEVRAALEALPL